MLALAALLLTTASTALACEYTQTEKACVRLAADRTAYRSGTEARIAAVVTIEPGWHVNSRNPTFEYLIPTEVQFHIPPGWTEPAVAYPPGTMQTFAFAPDPISVYDGQVEVIATLAIPASVAAGSIPIEADLRYQACTDDRCLPPITTRTSLDLELGEDGPPANQDLFAVNARSADGQAGTRNGLWLMLGFALLGGLILNIMPCVLPVLSLKLLSIAKRSGHDRARVVVGTLATSAGIVVSFWALAAVAIGLRASGAAVGWGIQFQEPTFIAALTVIVLLFSLNLWGLLEINLPGWLGTLGTAGPREGIPGDFTTGLFATLMATPCTAPFLGTSVGFALGQSNLTVLAMFTALGIGMALPYLLLAASPRAIDLLPAPGPWMIRLKMALGFVLAGAAVWLLFVLSAQVNPPRLAFFELTLLAVALFVWLRREASAPRTRRIMSLAALATIVGAIGLAHAGRGEITSAERVTPSNKVIEWRGFDRDEARRLSAGGRMVFVSVTADWCFTCKINESVVLETDAVASAFRRFNVIAMRADWTNPDERIAQFLSDHARSGIPFYLLYRPDGSTRLLSELLSKRKVLTALEEASTLALKTPD